MSDADLKQALASLGEAHRLFEVDRQSALAQVDLARRFCEEVLRRYRYQSHKHFWEQCEDRAGRYRCQECGATGFLRGGQIIRTAYLRVKLR